MPISLGFTMITKAEVSSRTSVSGNAVIKVEAVKSSEESKIYLTAMQLPKGANAHLLGDGREIRIIVIGI